MKNKFKCGGCGGDTDIINENGGSYYYCRVCGWSKNIPVEKTCEYEWGKNFGDTEMNFTECGHFHTKIQKDSLIKYCPYCGGRITGGEG